MFGPGKYDDLCTLVRERSGGKAVIICIFDGDQGTGMSAQFDLKEDPTLIFTVPLVLRQAADRIEEGGPSVQ